MIPVNGYLMLKKRPAEERPSGIVLMDGQKEEVRATGFEVVEVAKDISLKDFKPGDTVFPGYAEEARKFNGFIFCKATHIIAKE